MDKFIFQILFVGVFNLSWLQHAYAEDEPAIIKEIYLKTFGVKLKRFLFHNIEAQIFLGEDLSDALALVSKSKFSWTNSLQSEPGIFLSEDGSWIELSQHYSFAGTAQHKVQIILEIFFGLNRKLQYSMEPTPKFRISVFARKFSQDILDEEQNCSINLESIDKSFGREERLEFQKELTAFLLDKAYSVESASTSRKILIISKENTDTGCPRGHNRNLISNDVYLLNLAQMSSSKVSQIKSSSCGYSQKHYSKILEKTLVSLKTTIKRCSE